MPQERARLTFSPVEHGDLCLLLRALAVPGDRLEIQEDLCGRNALKLELPGSSGALTTRTTIVRAVAELAPAADDLLRGRTAEERLMIQQWLDFAYETVLPETQVTRSIETTVYALLHEQLARNTFVAGGLAPSVADWALLALLFGRIKAMVPSVAARYYRLVRWMDYLQHQLLRSSQAATESSRGANSEETAVFVPAVFDFAQLRAALAGPAVPPVAKPVAKSAAKQPATKPVATPQPAHPFARVDLRVGKIVRVEKHPNADRLYIEHVDLGEAEPRTVVSGLVEHVPMAELQDRLCVFICNLKPVTLCKVLSTAMLLVAKTPEGQEAESPAVLEPLIPPAGSVPGDRITIDGVTPQPDAVIKPKETTWESVRVLLTMADGVATYEGAPLLVPNKGPITSCKVPTGTIS